MLDKLSEKVLKFIKENGKTTLEQLNANFDETSHISSCIDLLLKLNYIKGTDIPYYSSTSTIIRDVKLCSYVAEPYIITPEGIAYLESLEKQREQSNIEQNRYKEEKHRSWIQFWIPVTISLIALFRPEIISFIKYLTTLLTQK